MYPPELVKPMKEDLTSVGFNQLTTTTDVDEIIKNSDGKCLLLVVNSVCGCAAGNMRPGVKLSLNNDKKPTTLATVFAGVDGEATNQARKYFLPYPPSSPSIALFPLIPSLFPSFPMFPFVSHRLRCSSLFRFICLLFLFHFPLCPSCFPLKQKLAEFSICKMLRESTELFGNLEEPTNFNRILEKPAEFKAML